MKIKTGTIVRTALLILALVNQCLSIAGKAVLPITDEQLEQVISLVITIAISIWNWWKNNSFTKLAIEADQWLDDKRQRSKAEKKTDE